MSISEKSCFSNFEQETCSIPIYTSKRDFTPRSISVLKTVVSENLLRKITGLPLTFRFRKSHTSYPSSLEVP